MTLGSFDLLNSLLTFLGLLITSISIFWAVYTYNRQMNAQLFLEYTSRYDKIMQESHDRASNHDITINYVIPEPSVELKTHIMRYLNLCSEEFYLWKNGYLSNNIWSIWQPEIKRTIRSGLYRREWALLKSEYTAYPEFTSYVESILSEHGDFL